MSDHTYTCKRCGSWWSCACDDGSPDDLCTDCLLQQQKDDELKGGDFNLTLAIIKERDDEIARLKAREKVLIDLICEAAPLAWAGSPQYYDHAVAWDERARQILDDYFDGQFERHHLGDGK